MNLIVRIFTTLLGAFFRPTLGALETSVIKLRVWPVDLDLNGHMNNGRYFSLMDLGRIDYLVRVGLLGVCLKRKWAPVVGAKTIQFRRSLKLFQVFELRTRVVCWNTKWIFIEQRFVRKGKLVAIGWVKHLFLSRAVGRSGNIRSGDVALAVDGSPQSPPIPDAVRLWIESEEAAEPSEPASFAAPTYPFDENSAS